MGLQVHAPFAADIEGSALDSIDLDEGAIDEIWKEESETLRQERSRKREQAVWMPHPGPQTKFLALNCHEILYGGAAGGGKSEALMVQPSRWFHEPGFYSVTLRREVPQLIDLLRKGMRIYGKRPKLNPFIHWNFGPREQDTIVRFGHCRTENDATIYQGQEIHLLCVDELTHFTRKQFDELKTRVRRGSKRLPKRGRYTSNPGGPGHEWVFNHWRAWLDPEFDTGLDWLPPRFDAESGTPLPPAAPEQILYFLSGTDGEHLVPKGTPKAQGRTFIPATLDDNPTLMLNDPDYEQRLLAQNDPVRVRQLRFGDWLARYAPGLLFKRGWFEIVGAAPAPGTAWRVRYWDRAATDPEKSHKPGDPDWTVGTLMCWEGPTSGKPWFVEDVVRFRGNPGEVWATILQTSQLDRKTYGEAYTVGLEQEPGASGKFEVESYISAMAGYNVLAFPPVGDKVARSGPLSAQCMAGNVKLVQGSWIKNFLAELEAFPSKDEHDDQVDATSGAFSVLTRLPLPYWQRFAGQSAAQARFGHLPRV